MHTHIHIYIYIYIYIIYIYIHRERDVPSFCGPPMVVSTCGVRYVKFSAWPKDFLKNTKKTVEQKEFVIKDKNMFII